MFAELGGARPWAPGRYRQHFYCSLAQLNSATHQLIWGYGSARPVGIARRFCPSIFEASNWSINLFQISIIFLGSHDSITVLDPLTALSVARTVVQFVDFAPKFIPNYEIYEVNLLKVLDR
jgi:hypothetical protein